MHQQPNKGAPQPKRSQDQEPDPKVPPVDSPDTAPEDHGAPSAADTDLPIEGQVRNDAVLRGEDHADEKIPPAAETEETGSNKS